MEQLIKNIRIRKGDGDISIPESINFKDNRVYIKKVGNALFLIPMNDPWKNLKDSLDLFSDDFMNERIQMDQESRETID